VVRISSLMEDSWLTEIFADGSQQYRPTAA